MKKLLTIIGARPQIIKAAAFSRAVKTNFNSELVEYIVHTGQHYDKELSQVFIDQLEVPEPHKNLGVRAGSHASQLAAMVEKIETQIIAIKPQAVLVYGDTNSTLAGALAASKMNIPIIHIEAGLRSFNKRMPEEINRITTDHVSTFLFSPTKTGLKNLEKEGFNLNTSPPFSINNPAVFHTGDIMYDNSLHFSAGNVPLAIISDLELTGQRYILATIHRPSNTDFKEPLERILSALMNESKERNIKIILPLHPRTRERIDTFFLNTEFRTKLENHAYLK